MPKFTGDDGEVFDIDVDALPAPRRRIIEALIAQGRLKPLPAKKKTSKQSPTPSPR